MNLSIGIVAFNEEESLPTVLRNVTEQTYPHGKMEILLIDSMSEDDTREQMKQFAMTYREEFLDIRVLENPGKRQSCGWNRAIDEFTTEALVRVDAHSRIPPDFIENNVRLLEDGEYITGGVRPNIVKDDTPWQNVLLTAESSLFGSSPASFRRKAEKTYVKSLFHGAYRREVFEKAGKFREDLGRTEDNEFHYRVRQKGFRICMSPDIVSYQQIRPSLASMCRQKFANGYWIGLTSGVCPGCLSLYHFVPFGFVCAILLTTIFAVLVHPLPAWILWTAYWLVAVVMAILAVKDKVRTGEKCPGDILLPLLFFVLHISYGAGTVAGIVKMPFWRRKHCGKEKR